MRAAPAAAPRKRLGPEFSSYWLPLEAFFDVRRLEAGGALFLPDEELRRMPRVTCEVSRPSNL